MIRVWRLLPKTFREKPFDVYAAFGVFGSALYALISPDFPEAILIGVPFIIWVIVDAYMILSSLVVLAALFCNSRKYPEFSYFGLMWGWAFLASASISLMTYLFYNSLITNSLDFSSFYFPLAFLWGCIGWAAFFKSLGMYLDYREMGKKP